MQAILFPTSNPAPAASAGRAPGAKAEGPRFLDVLAEVAGTDKTPGGEATDAAPAEETEATVIVDEAAPIEEEAAMDPPVEPEDATALETAMAALAPGANAAGAAVLAESGEGAISSEAVDAALAGTEAAEETTTGTKPAAATAGTATTPATTEAAGTEEVPSPTLPTAPAAGAKPSAPAAPAAPVTGEALPLEAAAETPPAVEGKTPAAGPTAPGTASDPLRGDPIALAISAAAVKSNAKPADLSVGLRRFQVAEAKPATPGAEAVKDAETASAETADASVELTRPVSGPVKAPPALVTPPAGNTPLVEAAAAASPAAPLPSAPPDSGVSQGVGLAAGINPSTPASTESIATAGTGPLAQPETPDAHGVGEQALRHLRLLAHAEGGQSIRVRLVPETLGELHLEVHRQGDTITVRMASANPAVRDALESQAQQIQHTLQKDGVQQVRVEISPGLNTDAEAGGRAQEQAHHARAQHLARGYTPPGGPGQNAAGAPARRVAQHSGNLNLFV